MKRVKAIEEIYQKKTQLEHILLRPDTYVGSIEREKSSKWILRENNLKFTNEEIMYVPALYKIFDQVLVNAADNYQRDKKMNRLKVQINQSEGYVSVMNNGKGIPVEIHKEHNIYVPQLIFGHLLTGSNYDDDEKKVVGGRNGYGAKLANIFSHKFVVECGDQNAKKKFKMTWKKNMTIHGQAEIQSYKGKDYTSVTFYPEFQKFDMIAFDSEIVSLMRKRVYDMAGLLPSVKVYLNEKHIQINTFLKYVDMYLLNPESIKIRDEQVDNQRWQVVASISQGQFRQVSFVNGICTSRGGTHVNYIVDQIVEKIQERIARKDKKLSKVKPFQIKGHLWVFVNCLIQNPSFDSQTKETLTLKQSNFGSQCILSQKFIKEVLKTGVVDAIIEQANMKERLKLTKLVGGAKKSKLSGIPKLQDANEAGTRNSDKCTLILTQGDSAKSLAMAGIEIIGRDYYGVFPLKGKLLNVRQAANAVLMKNQEIQNLIKIVGLKVGTVYQDTKSLRYGSIMIMSDQDTDGSHIKGLVVNFIHFFWPSLFKMRGFLKQFITPLLKVSKGRQIISFYTMSDFKRWAETISNLKLWKIKYYKGLGTSTDKEAQQYFRELQRNRIYFTYSGQQDDDSIDLVFNKKKADKRKQWLANYDPNAVLPYDQPTVAYHQFINKQFIHFSNQDNHRSIASIIDGFKPGQRKIIYSCFKRNLKDEIKVAQLAGYTSEHSAYHHGEMSLTMTIVNMAQNFVGSNNINLLMPNGQFGSRNQGGKDHASARYIFTNLNKITRIIFPEPDDHTLTYLEDDGQIVQPQFYVPILPMGLVNGAEGIGSGWSTTIPSFNPRQIVQILMSKLQNGEEFRQPKPWYKGFSGQINQKEDGNYQMKGILYFDEQKQRTIQVKQLPVGKWTKDYKQFLEQELDKQPNVVAGFREYHTKNRVHFQIQLSQLFYEKFEGNMPHMQRIFKMTSNISMKNMVGFDQQKKLHKYSSIKDILQQFYNVRLIFYQKRKDYLMSKLQRQMEILQNKQKFIIEVVEQKLNLRNVKKIKIIQILKKRGYTRFSDFTKIKSTKGQAVSKKDEAQIEQQDEKQQQTSSDAKQYNYLLNMPLWNLCYQKVEQIKRQCKQKQDQLYILDKTPIQQLWLQDLNEFMKVLDKVENQQQQQRLKNQDFVKRDAKGQKAKKKVQRKADKQIKKPKKKVAYEWQSDSNEETKFERTQGTTPFNEPNPPPNIFKNPKSQNIFKGSKKTTEKSKEPKQKKQLNKKQESNDLISRVKRKMQQAKKDDEGRLQVDVNMPTSQDMLNFVINKEDPFKKTQYVLKQKASNKKRSKMNIDSDEQSEDERSQSDWGR